MFVTQSDALALSDPQLMHFRDLTMTPMGPALAPPDRPLTSEE